MLQNVALLVNTCAELFLDLMIASKKAMCATMQQWSCFRPDRSEGSVVLDTLVLSGRARSTTPR
jgi:hypothetical protein